MIEAKLKSYWEQETTEMPVTVRAIMGMGEKNVAAE
ncbi:MAG: hypothetical protein ACJA13_001667 [Paraglaciecola sp.]